MLGQTIHHQEPQDCPVCKTNLNAMSAADADSEDAAPEPGDLTICSACASLLMIDEGMQYRIPTKQEVAELDESTAGLLSATQEIIRHFITLQTGFLS